MSVFSIASVVSLLSLSRRVLYVVVSSVLSASRLLSELLHLTKRTAASVRCWFR